MSISAKPSSIRPKRVTGVAPNRSPARALVLRFVRGDRFHQGNELTLHRLILDLAVGAQQPEAERAVEKQQTLHFSRLAVPVIEKCDGYIESGCDLRQARCADAVDALLVFLDLLEADAELVP